MPDPTAPKRPNYFQSQFLVVRDFQDEQKYHEESLRWHNRSMHEWGVVRDGLQVTRSGDNFAISAGSAIDSLGRQIILETARTLTAAEVQAARSAAGQDVFVTIAFREDNSTLEEDKYPPPGGIENVTRKVQWPNIVATRSPATDGTVIILAQITGSAINNLVRKIASSVIARGTNLGDISLDGALSFTSKTSPNPQLGLDYDPATDQLRIRARKSASVLDTTHLSIKRESGNVGIGTPNAATQKLEVYGALKLSSNPTVSNDNGGAYFWDQQNVGPTIAGANFEVRAGGDTVRFRIDGTGNVRIGTTNDPGKLEVYGALKLSSTPTVTNDNLGAYFWNQGSIGPTIAGFSFEVRTGGNTPRFRIDNNGRVGIGTGTEAPYTKFHVIGDGNALPATTARAQSVGQVVRLKGSANAILDIGAGSKSFWLQSTDETNLATNHALLLNPNGGEVGIGTTAPATKLHVVGPGSAMPSLTGDAQSSGHVARLRGTTTGSTTSPVLDIGSGGDKGFWLQSTNPADLTKNYPLLLNPNGGDIGIGSNLSIGGSLGIGGNVGIGTSAPRSSLHIQKDNQGGLGPTLTLMNGSGQEHAKVHIDLYTYWNTNQQLPSGRIICEDNAAGSGHLIFQTLDAVSTTKAMVERMRIDAASGDMKVSGKITCGGKIGLKSAKWTDRWLSARGADESWAVKMQDKLDDYEEFTLVMRCSREFKENISDLTALEAMTTLQNLTPVKYDYKGEKAFRQNLGFIAEDMPDNLSSENRKSISPFEVVPILTRVAKEQQRVIVELQESVRTLKEEQLWKSNYRSDSKN